MISSPLMISSYERTVPDYTAHNDRKIAIEAGAEPREESGER